MKVFILCVCFSFFTLQGSLSRAKTSNFLGCKTYEEEIILNGYNNEPKTRSVYDNFLVAYKQNHLIRVVSDNDIGIIQVKIYNNYSGLVYSNSFNTLERTAHYIDLQSYNKGKYHIQISDSSGFSLYGYFMLEDTL